LTEQSKSISVDVPHYFFSALTMAGVDCIQSMIPFEETRSKLINKITKNQLLKEWCDCLLQVNKSFEMYALPNRSKETKRVMFELQNTTLQLLFALKSNSSVLLLSNLLSIKSKSQFSPELILPFELLFSAIESKDAQLPIVKFDLPKRDIVRLLDIISSKEFETYKEAQSEVERNKKLTSKTINSIEKAGKDLYRTNRKYLALTETVVKAVPLSQKVIELFFGKLPGILVESTGKAL
jgi:hypothetical protein